jgi:hypothetical protein
MNVIVSKLDECSSYPQFKCASTGMNFTSPRPSPERWKKPWFPVTIFEAIDASNLRSHNSSRKMATPELKPIVSHPQCRQGA